MPLPRVSPPQVDHVPADTGPHEPTEHVERIEDRAKKCQALRPIAEWLGS
jgi:hypothetical protein